jgi:hypothetical protein
MYLPFECGCVHHDVEDIAWSLIFAYTGLIAVSNLKHCGASSVPARCGVSTAPGHTETGVHFQNQGRFDAVLDHMIGDYRKQLEQKRDALEELVKLRHEAPGAADYAPTPHPASAGQDAMRQDAMPEETAKHELARRAPPSQKVELQSHRFPQMVELQSLRFEAACTLQRSIQMHYSRRVLRTRLRARPLCQTLQIRKLLQLWEWKFFKKSSTEELSTASFSCGDDSRPQSELTPDRSSHVTISPVSPGDDSRPQCERTPDRSSPVTVAMRSELASGASLSFSAQQRRQQRFDRKKKVGLDSDSD